MYAEGVRQALMEKLAAKPALTLAQRLAQRWRQAPEWAKLLTLGGGGLAAGAGVGAGLGAFGEAPGTGALAGGLAGGLALPAAYLLPKVSPLLMRHALAGRETEVARLNQLLNKQMERVMAAKSERAAKRLLQEAGKTRELLGRAQMGVTPGMRLAEPGALAAIGGLGAGTLGALSGLGLSSLGGRE